MKNNNKKIRHVVIRLLLFVGIILFFSFIQGDVLKTYNETTNRWILETFSDTEILHRLTSKSEEEFIRDPYIADMIPESFGYAIQLENMNKVMENVIHIIIFFICSMGILHIMTLMKYSLSRKVIFTVIICVIGNYWSEIVQNSISGRGYETIDVINNNIGIASGVIAFLLYTYIRNKRKDTNKKKVCPYNEIVIKDLSGKNFFDD